jgi:mycofactocin precursor
MAPTETSIAPAIVDDVEETATDHTADDELELIEEISIDGMCGVY